MKLYTNGIGGTTGDSLATARPYQTTGDVWYVNSATGLDAGGNRGLSRTTPLATLAQAITNASDYDDIVCMAGHTQTLSAVQTIAKRVRIIGEGAFGSTSMPRFNRTAGGAKKLFDITVSRVQLRGLRFPVAAGAVGVALVAFSGTDGLVRGCYFEGDGNVDTATLLSLASGSDRMRVESTTFVSVGTTAPAYSAITSAAALADVSLIDVTVDGGTEGWAVPLNYAVDFTAGAMTNLRVENLSLLRDSDLGIHASSTGYVSLGTCSGSARVVHA